MIGPLQLLRLPFGAPCVRRGDVARDEARFLDAVMEYRRALRWMPWREDLKIQVGNCLKEFGDYEGAVRAYGSVTHDAQLGEARLQMRDAISRGGARLLPYAVTEHPEPGSEGELILPIVDGRSLPNRLHVDTGDPAYWLGVLSMRGRSGAPYQIPFHPGVRLVQVGTMAIDHRGVQVPFLAGVVAVRGRVSALAALHEVEVRLGGGAAARTITTAPLRRVSSRAPLLKEYAFNAWIDAGMLPKGRHWLSVTAAVGVPAAGLSVIVGEAVDAALPTSDSFVPSPGTGSQADLDQAVLAAPAQVRPAARGFLRGPPNSILAIRADQLGDVSASLPALRRLRALFPGARLTALVQTGVAAVVANSALADEVLTLDLVYSHETERRHLPDAERGRLAELLGTRGFDLAIDLSPGDDSRPLLLLSGATWLVGFNPDRHAFLDFGISIRSRDKSNRLNMTSHAASVAALVEALALAVDDDPEPVPADPAGAELLTPLGLAPGGYVVIHTGARHPINCWPMPNYRELTTRLLAATDDAIVFFGGADGEAPLGDPRVRRFDMATPVLFDALVSNARVMIGNDSGPKHLAAMRGVPTVSIHVNRLNWNEWGQTGRGVIVSKRVPCAGCALNNIELCAREAACVTSITVDEVMAALAPYLALKAASAGA